MYSCIFVINFTNLFYNRHIFTFHHSEKIERNFILFEENPSKWKKKKDIHQWIIYTAHQKRSKKSLLINMKID